MGMDIEVNHELELVPEGVYHLKWGFDETWIKFEIEVETTGWFGLGISKTGGMKDADIFTAWVMDDGTYLHHVRVLQIFQTVDGFGTINLVPSLRGAI